MNEIAENHSDNFLVVPDDNIDNFLDDNHKVVHVVIVSIRLTTVLLRSAVGIADVLRSVPVMGYAT